MQAAQALQTVCEVATLRQALAWQRAGSRVAIATVIMCWGSAPRPVGAKLAVREDGAFTGSVSGGCVENAVITAALACIEDGVARVLDYAGDAALPWAVGLPCGGSIRVHVEQLGAKYGPALRAHAAGLTAAIVTKLASGAYMNITEQTESDDAKLSSRARAVLNPLPSSWTPQLVSAPAADEFVDVLQPPLRMAIIGASHLAQALAAMAQLYGFEVVLIDPREAYLTPARFPNVRHLPGAPGAALRDFAPDGLTAVIAVSHDPKIDDPALATALRSEAFYIGALGSRKAQAARLERLAAEGFDEATLARIHGPVGLNIGAVTPAEISGSILAEITQIIRARA